MSDSIEVDPKDVELIFKCPECDNTDSMFADMLVEMGTAVCGECDCDMTLMSVEVEIPE